MLNQYKNIDSILSIDKSVSAERIPDIQRKLLSLTDIVTQDTISTPGQHDRIELHLYSDSTWITGNHTVAPTANKPTYIDEVTKQQIQFTGNPIGINLYNELTDLQITSGNFRFVINFFKNLIGSYETQYLVVDEISPDRTEVRLRLTDLSKHPLSLLGAYANTVRQTRIYEGRSVNKAIHKTYLLNFSRNQCFTYINSVVFNGYLYIKLLDPLPDTIQENLKCWVVEETKPPYIDRVSIIHSAAQKQFKRLKNPNWNVNASYNVSSETGLKTWNDLLGSSIPTSQQIVDAYFSGSLSGVKLNIDYSDFNNFIFYSSATERVKNFKYKLDLLEYFTSQSLILSSISGSVATTNIADYETQRINLISGFDGFEKFLYYESSSRLTTYDVPVENPSVLELSGSYITPVPKINSTLPYSLAPTTSSQFTNWYNGLLDSASYYDSYNYNSLIATIPQFVQLDNSNLNLITFVNMLGHHYDILYTYINHMSKLYNFDENPKVGVPNELLYSVAKQFGWNLSDGNQYQDLWQYAFGLNTDGAPVTGSTSINGTSMSGKEMTYTVWRRIINNLPYLLKSKGTKRSIQALLSCYGIPQSMISINEYGGPSIDRVPIYEKLNFDYALDLINTSAGIVNVNYSQSLNTVEVRFRTDSVVTNPNIPSTMNLFTVGNNTVTLDYTRGTLGTIQINGTGSADIEMFDGGWLTAMLRTSNDKLEIVAKRSKYGKIVAAVSASATASYALSGSVILGGTSTGAARLKGQLQELRLWSSSLSDSAFNNHVKAPAAYDGNIDAYNELFFRLPLTQKFNHSTTSSLSGVQPVASSMSASFTSWSSNEPYDSIEEMYYYDSVSVGTGTHDDNKVRIETSELTGNLDVKIRRERSQYDNAPLDSNKLGVYFSPQTMINEDIIAQLGFTSLDDYIGDPGDFDKFAYPSLIQKSHNYWKKYDDKNDFNAYIKIFTLFDLSFFRQLDQLLPARTNKMTGVLIQPNILERNKQSVLPDIKKFDQTYEMLLDNINPSVTASNLIYEAVIDDTILEISGYTNNYTSSISAADVYEINASLNNDYIMNLTASAATKYNGSIYSYSYLYYTVSGSRTGSSPYWRREALMEPILNSSYSENIFKLGSFATGSVLLTGGSYYGTSSYGSSSYGVSTYTLSTGSLARVQSYNSTGTLNHKYNGSKMSSRDFNIDSRETIDGGPVVEWNVSNGNQLIYQNLTSDGSFKPVNNT